MPDINSLARNQEKPSYKDGALDPLILVKFMVNRVGRLYPCVIDPRKNNPIPFPSGGLVKVPKSDRVPWGRKERGEYIAEWYRKDYETPPGGWQIYDIHHIKPREYGGTNDFENLVPVLRQVHIDEFNAFWRDW